MQANAIEFGGTIVPTLRYRDVAAAIDWLCKAFDFTRQLVVSGDDGTVRYAELTFGTGMVMIGPVESAGPATAAVPSPDAAAAETQVCYLFVTDTAGHCARAKAAGADIILDVDDEDSRGRGYSCRDPEGHVWTFGTYDPWKRSAAAREPIAPAVPADSMRVGLGRRLALAAAIVFTVIASAAAGGWAFNIAELHGLYPDARASAGVDAGTTAARELERLREELARERSAREEMQAQLVRERAAGREEARTQLANERGALADAKRAADAARERLSAIERSAQSAAEQLAAERNAKEAAERARLEALEQLSRERTARAAEQAAEEAAERAEREQRAKEQSIARKAVHRPRAAVVYRPPPRERPAFRPYARWDY